jgi:TPR repeat protein
VNLGAFLYLGRGLPRDRTRAEKLFAETCFRGDASACGEQGAALLSLRMDHPRDTLAGLGFVERACNAGEEDSCAAFYAHLLDDPAREKEGAAGLERLAGREIFSHALAQLYETGGVEVPKDPAAARRVAQRMCDSDFHCTDVAFYLSHGIGGPKDEGHAVRALTHGCEQEDFASCAELGARYRDGKNVTRDPTRAVELFRRSCEGAGASACSELSRAYLAGEGVPRDPAKALELARMACESGSPDGCGSVGVMIATGTGIAKDTAAAAPYLSFGCRRAVQAACAKLTELGLPVPELDL